MSKFRKPTDSDRQIITRFYRETGPTLLAQELGLTFKQVQHIWQTYTLATRTAKAALLMRAARLADADPTAPASFFFLVHKARKRENPDSVSDLCWTVTTAARFPKVYSCENATWFLLLARELVLRGDL